LSTNKVFAVHKKTLQTVLQSTYVFSSTVLLLLMYLCFDIGAGEVS